MKKYYILLASLILAVIGLAQLGEAQSAAPLTVTEVDGSPTRTGIRKLVVSNGTLTIAGQTATVTTGGGGGGGSVNVNGGSVSSPNFNGTTPAAPAGTVNVIYQVSGSNVSAYSDYGSLSSAFDRKPFYATDFMNPGTSVYGNTDMTGSAISSGTAGATATGLDANHPGIINLSSSTTTNSGFRFNTAGGAVLIGGGERFDVIFRPTVFTNSTARFGFHDATSITAPIDGAYFQYSGSGDVVGVTVSNSTSSTSATIATLSVDTWYHAVLVVNNTATQVDYSIFSEAGTLLGTQSLTTNIPTGVGRETGVCWIVTNSGTTSQSLARLDYISYAFTRALTRGQ